MFYIGALLIANGRYTFAKMLEVFTLIIFSITFSAQIMTFRTSSLVSRLRPHLSHILTSYSLLVPAMTKSIHAASDFARILDLDSETKESQGRMTFPVVGHIQFENVIFSYPSRPNAPVLKGMSFEVRPGECVGIIGCVPPSSLTLPYQADG